MPNLSKKQRAFAKLMAGFISELYRMGYEVTFGDAYRDNETQKRKIASGASKTMLSKHCDRLALDLNLWKGGQYTSNPNDYRIPGELWEKMGGSWGGRFGIKVEEYAAKVGWDSNHFEFLG